MKEKAYAKINLGLHVLGTRHDGYHEVDMIMQSVSLADEIEFTVADSFLLTTDNPILACDASNLAWKASQIMATIAHRKPNVHIHIKKKIFIAAGLAGGSTDGAAVLRGLNKLWNMNLSMQELENVSAKLGSDVPFCIAGGTTRATGRGEILKPLPDIPIMWLVLAKPYDLDVSTTWVYENICTKQEGGNSPIDALETAIIGQDDKNIIKNIANVLELVTIPAYPVIAEIKMAMLRAGALAVLMSGSGPTVFGLAADKASAEMIATVLQANTALHIAVARTIKRSETL
jgi:4-diphosphocytidyl-2-C-methyl-D-erythritol kinase